MASVTFKVVGSESPDPVATFTFDTAVSGGTVHIRASNGDDLGSFVVGGAGGAATALTEPQEAPPPDQPGQQS